MTTKTTPVGKVRCGKCGSGDVRKDGWLLDDKDHGRNQQRYKCKSCGHRGAFQEPSELPGISPTRVAARRDLIEERIAKDDLILVVTAAQNATPVHGAFFRALRRYCERRGALLAVIPYRYHNPTSIWSEKAQSQDWWAPELLPYLCYDRINLHKHLTLMGNWRMQPTAVNPLEGLESVTGSMSGIFGHPKLALKTVATPQDSIPKILTTTGAITIRNYIPSKAGRKGEFHHTFGATVIEIKDGLFHIRQINAMDDGSFIDLDTEYRAESAKLASQPLALVLGDVHMPFVDPEADNAVFGKGGMVAKLMPQHIVFHDLHDFFERSHHHNGEPFVNYAKFHAGADNVEKSLRETFAWLDQRMPEGAIPVIVRSNHHDHLSRWVKEANPKADPRNAVFWAKTFVAMCEGSAMTAAGASTIDPFAYWGRQWLQCAERARFLDYDESFILGSVELTYHGHKGPGGVRGSRSSMRRIGAKTIIAHGHGPGIDEGCYQVGHMRRGADYTAGAPSNWLTTMCVLYANGKRSLLHVIKGKWHG